MGRRSSSKRQMRMAAQAAPAPPVTNVTGTARRWIAAAAIFLFCGAGGYAATQLFGGASVNNVLPRVVEGDGVRGPKGMVWVPGGAFLMGSDHKLAQPNERPTHRVKLGGFWMDRTHV